LLLNNVTFNPVPADVAYVYKIGSFYFRVPLCGKLVKIFDFGLTTDKVTFYQPTRPGKVPTHWCVGGRGHGKEDELQCAVATRDLLELFFRLQDEYGQASKKGRANSSVLAWLTYAWQRAQANTDDTLSGAVKVLSDIFHPTTLQRHGLPAVVEVSTQRPALSPYQAEPFEVVNRKKYIQRIYDVLDQKVWDA